MCFLLQLTFSKKRNLKKLFWISVATTVAIAKKINSPKTLKRRFCLCDISVNQVLWDFPNVTQLVDCELEARSDCRSKRVCSGLSSLPPYPLVAWHLTQREYSSKNSEKRWMPPTLPNHVPPLLVEGKENVIFSLLDMDQTKQFCM